MEPTQANNTKLNVVKEKTNCSDPCALYFSVWCYEAGIIQSDPWKVGIRKAQDMQTAAEMFVQDYDKKADRFFAKNCSSQFNNSQCSGQLIVSVQDWRGRIAMFEIEVEARPHYIARRIQ